MLAAMGERSGIPRTDKRERVAPQRRSGARGKADGLPELSELVVRYFFAELEAAIRHAFEELLGRPPASKFTLHLDNAPRRRRSHAGPSA